MGYIQLQISQYLVGLHELFFSFSREADDNIGRDRTARNFSPDFSHDIAIILLGIATVHIFQHRVITGLDRQFNMRHDIGQAGNGVDQFIAEVIGVGCQKAYPLDTIHFADQFK